MKKRILAIPAAPAAIPPNPNTPATKAKIIKVTVQRNISYGFNLSPDYLLISTLQISRYLKHIVAANHLDLNAIA